MKDLNVIHETIKLLEDNISNMLFSTGLSNIFWKCLLRQRERKQTYTQKSQTKKILHSEETINKVKWPPTEREKIFTNDILQEVNSQTTQNLYDNIKKIKKWGI